MNFENNTYLASVSKMLEGLEDEATALAEQKAKLKAEVVATGARWDAFMTTHTMRRKLNAEDREHWRRTFDEAAGQLRLFETAEQ